MEQNIEIPKGTRDFSPAEMAKRNYIFNIIKEVFILYGLKKPRENTQITKIASTP